MKLFVGSLPYNFTDANLSELFGQVGKVLSAKIIMDRYTGRSRGFGFVEMSSEEEGKAAIEKFDGFTLEKRSIVVKKAHENERRPRFQKS